MPRAASPENPTTSLSNPDQWLLDWAGGAQGFGPPTNEQTAMTVSAVYRCVSLISGLLAGTPLHLFRDDPKAGRLVVHPDIKDDLHSDGMRRLARTFAQAPMPGRAMTAYSWRELWGANVLLWGNHYSVARYDGAGRVLGYQVAMPWTVEVRSDAGRNSYVVTWPEGRREVVAQEDILHFAGPGFDGIKGVSRIASAARNAVAMSRLLEEQSGRVHENAARPSGLIRVGPGITPEGLKRLQAHYSENYTGRVNVGRPIFVDSDTNFTPFQMTPADLATLDQRRYTVAEICRFFGVPPHLVGEAAGTSAWGTGIEQLTIGFLRFTMEQEFQRVESEINNKLLNGTPYYAWFDRDALAAVDAKTAAEVVQTRIQSGRLTINEARRRDKLPAVEGGDVPMVNATMIPLSRALSGNPPAPPPPRRDNPHAPR